MVTTAPHPFSPSKQTLHEVIARRSAGDKGPEPSRAARNVLASPVDAESYGGARGEKIGSREVL